MSMTIRFNELLARKCSPCHIWAFLTSLETRSRQLVTVVIRTLFMRGQYSLRRMGSCMLRSASGPPSHVQQGECKNCAGTVREPTFCTAPSTGGAKVRNLLQL